MEKQNYNTKAKRYILELLQKNPDISVTASEILEFLNSSGMKVNLTTVYRCLARLTDEHRVLKFKREDGNGALYRLAEKQQECDEHLHIQCVNCGKLSHLDCEFMDELKEHISKEHGIEIKCAGSVLYGVCNDCKKN